MDTPGILWPKFESEDIGKRLAFIGSINDEILDSQELCIELLTYIRDTKPGCIAERYSIDETGDIYEVLGSIAGVRGCLAKGGEVNTAKAASIVLDEFRSGKLGKITLEKVPDEE